MGLEEQSTLADGGDPLARRRRLALFGVAGSFAVLAVAAIVYWFFLLRPYETTDNAYVSGNVVQVTAQIAGTVVSIAADDNDFVQAGQPIVTLDDADAKLALDQSQAELARVVRDVRSLFANSAALREQVRMSESNYAKAQEDLNRRSELAKEGAVSTEETEHARSALSGAQSALAMAREQLTSNLAQTDGTTLENHPRVAAAAARIREAYLNLRRTTIPAPVSGHIAKRAAQVGQRVQPGAPLMAIIALDDLWVDANFKEGQLGAMRIGQPVTLESDVYGSSVEFHGRVAGVAAGTGSAFALLPAQNASGNWIKVVQRVPVRIALQKDEVQKNPLRIGLSMRARVAIGNRDGAQLSTLVRPSVAYATAVFDADAKAADQLIASIIATNAAHIVQANTAKRATPIKAARNTERQPGV